MEDSKPIQREDLIRIVNETANKVELADTYIHALRKVCATATKVGVGSYNQHGKNPACPVTLAGFYVPVLGIIAKTESDVNKLHRFACEFDKHFDSVWWLEIQD